MYAACYYREFLTREFFERQKKKKTKTKNQKKSNNSRREKIELLVSIERAAGDCVYVLEGGIVVFVVDIEMREEEEVEKKCDKCEFCGTTEGKLKRCGQCRSVFYCSVDCQKKDWKQRHGVRCKELGAKRAFIEKELERKTREENELEEDIRKMNEAPDARTRQKLQRQLEIKTVIENAPVAQNYNEMLQGWTTPEVLETRREAIRRNDPFLLVKFALNQRNPERARAVAAELGSSYSLY